MTTQPPLLELPASTVIAGLACDLLDDAARAIARLADRRDTEAMHDFRVAIRRLRSSLRAYRPWLRSAAGRKIRHGLRDIGDATNTARDAEIQLAWLEAARGSLSRGERSGLNWIVRRLRETRRNAYASARHDVRESFERTAETLRARLAEMSGDSPPLRTPLAALLREHVDDLGKRLGAIRSPGDKKSVHEARICAKRLRYLLEPLRRETAEAKALVRSFKAIQDLLGELHDVHVLEATLETALDEASREKAAHLRQLAFAGDKSVLQRERRRDERLGLVSLAAKARIRRDELFAEFEKQWLARRAKDVLREVNRFADSLTSEPVEEKLPVECERKYLLSAMPPLALESPSAEIDQGWLPGKQLRERIRRMRDDGGERFFRTVKLGSGIERIEIEDETTADVFAAMWPLTRGCRIRKRRYRVPEGNLVWEIDRFADRDLVLAEVELSSADQDVGIPDWLTPFVVREVTDEAEFQNLSLASQAA